MDSANNRVAIGTTVPTASLDVRGKILSDSQVESFVGKFVGIVTAGAVGVTTMTTLDAVVTGFSTLGLANATSLNVTTGFSTVQSLTADDITVSIGATVSKDLNVGGATTVGGALTVTGNAYFNGNVDINGDLTYDEVNAPKPKYIRHRNGWIRHSRKHDCCWYDNHFIIECWFWCNDGEGARNTSNQSWYQLNRPCIYIRCRW